MEVADALFDARQGGGLPCLGDILLPCQRFLEAELILGEAQTFSNGQLPANPLTS